MTMAAIGGVFWVVRRHFRHSRQSHPVAARIFGMRTRL